MTRALVIAIAIALSVALTREAWSFRSYMRALSSRRGRTRRAHGFFPVSAHMLAHMSGSHSLTSH